MLSNAYASDQAHEFCQLERVLREGNETEEKREKEERIKREG